MFEIIHWLSISAEHPEQDLDSSPIFWDLDLRPVDLNLRPMDLDLTHLDLNLGVLYLNENTLIFQVFFNFSLIESPDSQS